MAVLFDLARLFAGVALLAFAAYTDWRWRRAPNVLWVVMALVGVILLGIEAALDPAPWSARWPYLLPLAPLVILASDSDRVDLAAGVLALAGAGAAFYVGRATPEALTTQWPWLAAAPVFAAAMYAFYHFGLIAGGADAKALLALSTLAPFPLALAEGMPPLASPLSGAFVILGNSLLVFLVVPLTMLAWNVAHGDVRLPHAFLGVKREAGSVRKGHQWPMELVQADGTRKTRLFASRMSDQEVDEAFERVQALGAERVWVSPKIPFMIPLLGGFVLAFAAGDVLMWIIRAVLG